MTYGKIEYEPIGCECIGGECCGGADDFDALIARIDTAMSIEPEDHATKSRDYGRGFAEAIRQVRAALCNTSA